ncbi:histidine phosphatase family protein [Lysinibacillus xylanilyticus]|uniref:histidine phosphatase family protein n=1 Tax=Lysinibacillus xylanilyticus TaxID=582475 RepID=UPI002B23F491|nr:histidine phosphatase family protein [Lysinibacillus xylanilyticus]MEB2301494.1 histidine phosphatase family protein [Lysinibacillus xylanilyticus]
MTVIYFVRHAHSHYTADEYNRPLSAKGVEDRDRVTNLFTNKIIHAIYSSPYKRSVQTVEGIAQEHKLEINTIDSLKERILSNGKLLDFDAAIHQVWSHPNFAFEGGESNETAKERAITTLQKIILAHPNDNIVIGTHGNIMVLMMQYFDAQYNYSFWKGLSMPDVYQLTLQHFVLSDVQRIWKD